MGLWVVRDGAFLLRTQPWSEPFVSVSPPLLGGGLAAQPPRCRGAGATRGAAPAAGRSLRRVVGHRVDSAEALLSVGWGSTMATDKTAGMESFSDVRLSIRHEHEQPS